MQTRIKALCLVGAASTVLLFSVAGVAQTNEMYQYLPADTVVQQLKQQFQSQGIDPEKLSIAVDTQGMVTVSGEVASKQQADALRQLAMHTAGVYGVIGEVRYASADPIQTNASQTEANPSESVDTPAANSPAPEATETP